MVYAALHNEDSVPRSKHTKGNHSADSSYLQLDGLIVQDLIALMLVHHRLFQLYGCF